jgi:PPOX class probable F420-dependent enzyme
MAELSLVRELAQASSFLAVFSTVRPDGTIHSSLVSAGVAEDPETGQPCVGAVIGGGSRKLQYLRQNGRATAVFKDGWSWVAVEGPVRLEGPDDPAPAGANRSVPQLIRDVYQAAGGTHDDWDEFDRVMAEDRRCAVFISPDRITTNG